MKTDTYQSHTRNKLIAEAFYLTKDIEKYGSGYIRVRNEIRDYPTMTFKYKEVGNGFLVNLKYEKQKITSRYHENVTENVTENRERLILNIIKENKNITTTELSKKLNVTRRTIARNIDNLKNKNKLERKGPDKGGYWIVITD